VGFRVHRRHPAQVRPHPGQQLGQPHRLGQVVVRAGFQAHHDVHLLGAGGENDQDRRGVAGPQLPAYLNAVQVGQAQVQQHQIEVRFGGRVQRAPAGALPPDLVAVCTQARLQHAADGLVVLYYQQPRHIRQPSAARERHSSL
jgi:hypothetical protein